MVAIGPALVQPSSGLNQTTLYITAKNLLTMKSLLNMSHMYSELLGSSWYIVLNTLQHLTWTLGLRPTLTSQGQLKHTAAPVNSANATSVANAGPGAAPANNETMITTAIQACYIFFYEINWNRFNFRDFGNKMKFKFFIYFIKKIFKPFK